MYLSKMNGLLWAERGNGYAGLVPTFLHANNEAGAKEQINTAYAHGGGWHEFSGFGLNFNPEKPGSSTISYPDDPDLHVVAYTKLRDEWVLLFEYSWCVITTDGKEFNCARLD